MKYYNSLAACQQVTSTDIREHQTSESFVKLSKYSIYIQLMNMFVNR